MELAYEVVDVFTDRPLEGNPLAVFPDASALTGEIMRRIARELNLSETAFVLPSTRTDCDARVRIFTPTTEMAFAGHPTIGTAFVLLRAGRVPQDRFTLELNVGPVPIRVEPCDPPILWLRTPAITFGATFDPSICASAVGLDVADLLPIAPQLVTAGNPTIFIALRDPITVDRAWCDTARLASIVRESEPPACVFVFAPTPNGAYSRMFAPRHGVPEDPATGSSTGPLAAYMIRHDLVPGNRFMSEQGVKMGRRSVLHVEIRGVDAIDVGGSVAPFASATCRLPEVNES